MSILKEYCIDILDGRIVACEKIKLVSEKLLTDIENPKRWHFDEEEANRHVEFIEKFCKTPSGKIGTPLVLQPFQIARLQAAFGFVDDENIRRYNEVLTVEGRKNGKSTELSAVLLDMLVNDGEGAPQCVTAATQLDQAKLTFNAAHKMIKQSPMLSKHIRKRASDLYFPKNLGYIKALASNTNSLDGLDLHCCIIDELAAIKNRDLYDLLKQGMAARIQPILWCITTNGFIRNGIFDAQYQYASKILTGEVKNERFLPFIYELDSPEEMWNEKFWIKANPGLDTIKSREFLRDMVQKAKDDPETLPTVLVKDFNIPQTGASAWLNWEDLNNEQTFDVTEFDYCIGGFDAADSVDLNAAKAIFMRPNDDHIYVKSMYWIPAEVMRQQELKGSRVGRDKVPYDLWIEQGLMRTCEGNKCDKRIFLEWFKELRDELDIYSLYIGYDPWHIDDTLLAEFKAEFGRNSMIPIRQGVATLSEPMKNLKADLQSHKIIYNNNPVDKWCLMNTEIKTDINGNIQPIKGVDRTQRIDGTIALICAYIALRNNINNYIDYNKPKEGELWDS